MADKTQDIKAIDQRLAAEYQVGYEDGLATAKQEIQSKRINGYNVRIFTGGSVMAHSGTVISDQDESISIKTRTGRVMVFYKANIDSLEIISSPQAHDIDLGRFL